MEFKITPSKPKFEPIKLEIEIQSLGELAFLVAAINLSPKLINKAHSYIAEKDMDAHSKYELWNTLDQIYQASGGEVHE